MKDTTLALRHTNALITLKFGDESRMAVVKDVQLMVDAPSASAVRDGHGRSGFRVVLLGGGRNIGGVDIGVGGRGLLDGVSM